MKKMKKKPRRLPEKETPETPAAPEAAETRRWRRRRRRARLALPVLVRAVAGPGRSRAPRSRANRSRASRSQAPRRRAPWSGELAELPNERGHGVAAVREEGLGVPGKNLRRRLVRRERLGHARRPL